MINTFKAIKTTTHKIQN